MILNTSKCAYKENSNASFSLTINTALGDTIKNKTYYLQKKTFFQILYRHISSMNQISKLKSFELLFKDVSKVFTNKNIRGPTFE